MRWTLLVISLLLCGCGRTPPKAEPAADAPAEAEAAPLRARKAEFCGFSGFTVEGQGGEPVYSAKPEPGEGPDLVAEAWDAGLADVARIGGDRRASGYKVLMTGGCATGDESGFEVILLDGDAAAVRQTFFKANPQLRDDPDGFRGPLAASDLTCIEGYADGIELADGIEQIVGGKLQLEAATLIPSDQKIVGRKREFGIVATSNGKTLLYCGDGYAS